jgi:5'-nucleotidase
MNGKPIKPDDTVTVAAQAFLAEGGDRYDAFKDAKFVRSVGQISDILIAYFRAHSPVDVPKRGRQFEVSN